MPPFLLLLAFVATTAAASPCPANYTLHFTVTRRGPGRPAFDAAGIQAWFQQALPADRALFRTRTTSVNDVCGVATLAMSDRSAGAASVKAVRASQPKRQARSVRTAVYAVVAVEGAEDFQAVHTTDLAANVERALGGSVRVDVSVQEGVPASSVQGLRERAMGVGAAPSLPPRTHTFAPYASSAVFKSYVPVVVATPDFSGELPLDLVGVADGMQFRGSMCAVKKVFRSPRKRSTWTELSWLESKAFTVRSTATGIRLGLSLGQSTFFLKLRGQVDLGKDGQGAAKDFFGSLLGPILTGVGGSLGGKRRRLQLAAIRSSDNQTATTQNYATADYAYDYAVLFDCGASKNLRVDLTIVPRINRGGVAAPGAALLCQPGSAAQGLQHMPNDAPALSASSGACPAFPRRAAAASGSRVLDSSTFAGLHPEESDWVAARLAKTRARMASFIEQNLPPSPASAPAVSVDAGRAELRLAIAVSGGGKRSLFNAAGVLSGLSRAGVLDLATWTAGASGGAWLLGGVYTSSLGKTGLVDPATYVLGRMADLSRSVFDGTFRANEVLTNFGTPGLTLPVAPFAATATAAATTDKILCQAELKFQSPAVPASQTGTPAMAEYWARALGYQLLAAPEGGSGLTFSGLARDGLLAAHNAPLPLLQLQQNLGDGSNSSRFRLWEVSPFDVSVHQGDVHVSYPTALWGTDPADPGKRCVSNADQLSSFLGISSWIFPAANEVAGGTLKTLVCGEAGSACQPVPLNNPFLGHSGPSRQAVGAEDLFASAQVNLVDGATQWNNPLWEFVTPTRQADVAIVVDSSGWTDAPPISTDPTGTCAADAASCGPQAYYAATPGGRCCDTCSPLLDFSCWPTADPADNDLFSLPRFSPEHTLPRAWPSSSTDEARLQRTITEITFFGCTEPNKTAIVYVPNRAVSSAKSGFIALRNALELNAAYGLDAAPLGSADLNDVVKNGQDQVGAPALKGCLACLFHASLRDQNRATYWETSPRCRACFDRYCFAG